MWAALSPINFPKLAIISRSLSLTILVIEWLRRLAGAQCTQPFHPEPPSHSEPWLWVTWHSESRLTSLCMMGTQRPRWNGWEEIHTALEIRLHSMYKPSVLTAAESGAECYSQPTSRTTIWNTSQTATLVNPELMGWAVAAFIPCHTAKLYISLNILLLLIQLLLFMFTVEMFHTSVFIALRIWCLYPSLAYFTDFFFNFATRKTLQSEDEYLKGAGA